MRIQIIAIGQKMPSWVDQACNDYLKRIPTKLVSLSALAAAARKVGQNTTRIQQAEADGIRGRIQAGDFNIVLDERGKQWSSREWADQLQRWQQDMPGVNLIIGGADGLAPDLIDQADQRIALGRMTLPHALARVVLIEQLYRAWSINSGHPYHRD